MDLPQGKGCDAERPVLMDQHRAIFAPLYDQRLRAQLENVAGGQQQVMLDRELAGP